MGEQTINSKADSASTAALPIVIDLDGTLTPTDTLVESFLLLVRRAPLDALRGLLRLPRGRAAFKDFVASRCSISGETLPLREEFVEYLRAQRGGGCRLVLATAANYRIANSVAARLGIFDDVIASNAVRNLKGAAKLSAIRERVLGDFIYAGDSAADLPVWRAARAAILVGAAPGVEATVRLYAPVAREFPRERASLGEWLRALRAHQWLKNVLLFVPLLTAFSFLQVDKLAAALTGFVAFSLAASATYLVNDLWDLESDRAHPRKRHRAFASARIPIVSGIAVATAALALALAIAALISPGFLVMLALYVTLTSAYSWVLKGRVLIDVLTLSLLYTLRIVAGSVAIEVTTSSWLLAFSVFIFFSLALVKRCSELVSLEQMGRPGTSGRDYSLGDLIVLWPLGVAAAMCSVVVFGLFISAPETQARYANPELLWLVAVGLIYWLSRLWIKTARKQMHDDPLVFALRDRGSRVTMAAMIITTLAAHYLRIA